MKEMTTSVWTVSPTIPTMSSFTYFSVSFATDVKMPYTEYFKYSYLSVITDFRWHHHVPVALPWCTLDTQPTYSSLFPGWNTSTLGTERIPDSHFMKQPDVNLLTCQLEALYIWVNLVNHMHISTKGQFNI